MARKPFAIEANSMQVGQEMTSLSTELIYGLPSETSRLERL
jgi:hypothetical protein